jgi:hypothetical protein
LSFIYRLPLRNVQVCKSGASLKSPVQVMIKNDPTIRL